MDFHLLTDDILFLFLTFLSILDKTIYQIIATKLVAKSISNININTSLILITLYNIIIAITMPNNNALIGYNSV